VLIIHLHLGPNIKKNLRLYLHNSAKVHMGCNDSSLLLYLPLHMHVCVNEHHELKAFFFFFFFFAWAHVILYRNQDIISTTLSKVLHGFVSSFKGMC